MKNLFLLLVIFILASCAKGSGGSYEPIGLRKLSEEEMLERVQNKRFQQQPVGVVFKTPEGDIITPERLKGFNQVDFFGDQYVDGNGVLKEVVIRKATSSDRKIMERLKEATAKALEEVAQEGNELSPTIVPGGGSPEVELGGN